MDNQTQINDFEQLLSRLSEGQLETSEVQRLGELIEADRPLRKQYLEYCQMHSLLRSEHGVLTACSTSSAAAEEDGQVSLRKPRISRSQSYWIAAAASLLVVAAGVSFLKLQHDRAPYRGAETAVLGRAVGARFAFGSSGELVPLAGSKLRQGVYELLDGLVEIDYPTGAVLDRTSSGHIRPRRWFVRSTRRWTNVGARAEAGHRLSDRSTGATVIDLGTDFGVQAVKDQESEVHVFHGEVLVDLHGEKGKSEDQLRLVTGEATRVDYSTGMPSGINMDEERFVRSLREETSPYARAVLKMSPAVYYRMEPTGDGTKLIDASGNGADATVHLGRASAPVWTTGKVGAALRLGGPAQQSYASVNKYPQATGDSISIVAWVYARSRPRWASIAKNWAGGDQDRGQFHFGLHLDSGELEAHIVDSSGAEITVRDSVPLPLNTWHHVAFVADGENLRLYRNGVEVDSKPYHELHRDPRIKALAIGTKLNLLGDCAGRARLQHVGRLPRRTVDFQSRSDACQVLELCELTNTSG